MRKLRYSQSGTRQQGHTDLTPTGASRLPASGNRASPPASGWGPPSRKDLFQTGHGGLRRGERAYAPMAATSLTRGAAAAPSTSRSKYISPYTQRQTWQLQTLFLYSPAGTKIRATRAAQSCIGEKRSSCRALFEGAPLPQTFRNSLCRGDPEQARKNPRERTPEPMQTSMN